MTSVALRGALYGGALAAAFGTAFAVGTTSDPVADAWGARPEGDPNAVHLVTTHGGHETGKADHAPAGLAASQDGYTLIPADPISSAGEAVQFRFTVTGPDGRPVTAYAATHAAEIHMIVVRRDLARFQHVHPVRSGDGTWSVTLDLSAGGTYRAFADFRPVAGDRPVTLGTDISVAGTYRPVPLPAAASSVSVDAVDVAIEGSPIAGEQTQLTFILSRAGHPVTVLEPYLGAFGHLVGLRAGDLAYLHAHPAREAQPEGRGGPQVGFAITFPTAGTYRLFLNFQLDGAVRTAEFTVGVAAPTRSSEGTM